MTGDDSAPIRARPRLRSAVVGVPLLAIALVGIITLVPAAAQDYVRVDGTVQWVSGQSLVLTSDLPSTAYAIVGQYLVPVPGPRPTVNVDLSRLPQSEYAFMRPGERLSVIGLVSSDGRRLIATSIIRRAEQTP